MKKIAGQPRLSLTLWSLICALAISGCATTSPPAAQPACPKLSPAPSNVMREPSSEARLRELLFAPAATPTTSSGPAKPWSSQTVPR